MKYTNAIIATAILATSVSATATPPDFLSTIFVVAAFAG